MIFRKFIYQPKSLNRIKVGLALCVPVCWAFKLARIARSRIDQRRWSIMIMTTYSAHSRYCTRTTKLVHGVAGLLYWITIPTLYRLCFSHTDNVARWFTLCVWGYDDGWMFHLSLSNANSSGGWKTTLTGHSVTQYSLNWQEMLLYPLSMCPSVHPWLSMVG